MKKLILLLFIPFVLGCSSDSDNDDEFGVCIDETLINLETPCPLIYYPVCGCDGNSYGNSCEALNWNGVIAFEDGTCD